MVNICDFFSQNDPSHFVVVFMAFGVNRVMVRFARLMISCDCILDLDKVVR